MKYLLICPKVKQKLIENNPLVGNCYYFVNFYLDFALRINFVFKVNN